MNEMDPKLIFLPKPYQSNISQHFPKQCYFNHLLPITYLNSIIILYHNIFVFLQVSTTINSY